jgi:arginase
VVVLDAPTSLGLKPPGRGREPGVRLLPEALRRRNLLTRLRAADGGRVPVPEYRFAFDRRTGIRNIDGIRRFSTDLATALEPILAGGGFPVVLGGDCSLLLGTALALRRRGAFGVCFVDGHQDLLTPRTSETGGAAGMDLALACGLGPKALAELGGAGPLVEPSSVLLMGDRSGDGGYPSAAARRLRRQMFHAPLADLRKHSLDSVLDAGLARLRALGLDQLWLHLDVDVLDDEIMPAVDSRQPGGMSWDELGRLLRRLLTSGMLCGLQLTILDPERDPDGACVDALAQALETAFSAARAGSA